MVDEPSLQLIQAMLQRVLDGQRRADEKMDRMLADIGDLKIRMTEIEANLSHVQTGMALINARIDRVETRLDRIERRLELIPAS